MDFLILNIYKDKTMSEDIRKMTDKVKNFKQFINDNNEKQNYLSVDILWDKNKESGWYVDGILILLNDFYTENFKNIDTENEEVIYHIQTIEYFIDKFKNKGVDLSDTIEINNENIVFFNHRLVAAKFLNLKEIPVTYI